MLLTAMFFSQRGFIGLAALYGGGGGYTLPVPVSFFHSQAEKAKGRLGLVPAGPQATRAQALTVVFEYWPFAPASICDRTGGRMVPLWVLVDVRTSTYLPAIEDFGHSTS